MATPKSEGPGVSLQSAAKGVTNIGKQSRPAATTK